MPLATTVLTSIPREAESAAPEATRSVSPPRKRVGISERTRERLQVIERLLDSCKTPRSNAAAKPIGGERQVVPIAEQAPMALASEN